MKYLLVVLMLGALAGCSGWDLDFGFGDLGNQPKEDIQSSAEAALQAAQQLQATSHMAKLNIIFTVGIVLGIAAAMLMFPKLGTAITVSCGVGLLLNIVLAVTLAHYAWIVGLVGLAMLAVAACVFITAVYKKKKHENALHVYSEYAAGVSNDDAGRQALESFRHTVFDKDTNVHITKLKEQ